jgi:hypothetical protein
MRIGQWIVQCHVLDDERRIISQSDFSEILELDGKVSERGAQVASLLGHRAMASESISRLIEALRQPVVFRTASGSAASGFEGALVVDYCHAVLRARQQRLIGGPLIERYCVAAENLLLSVSKVGIVALIDEATGYQHARPRKALQELLDRYLRHHWAAWAKRFPDDFYVEMFRLKKWDWKGMKVQRPAVVGHYTNDLVYSRLAPAILDELRKRNPTDEQGRRKRRHHQWLTDDVGHPALSHHLHTVIAFMRASHDWAFFKRQMDRAFPKIGETYLLELGEELPTSDE